MPVNTSSASTGSGRRGSARLECLPYAASIFLSATLLFAVQPMVTKLLLPRFGGSPAVWNTAMVFFQAVLLCGYAYAHVAVKALGLRRHALLHAPLALLPLLLLPPALPGGLIPPPEQWPVPWVVAALALIIGAPFFILASNSTLVQYWFGASGVAGSGNPYRLYAASNAGSLLGLMAYPFFFEPMAGLRHQGLLWTAGYLLFAGLTLALLWRGLSRGSPTPPTPPDGAAPASPDTNVGLGRPTSRRRALWLLRPAVASSLLLSVTLEFTTDVASVPLFWVLPLALYLTTFILAFGDPDRLPLRRLRLWSQIAALACLILLTSEGFLAKELLSVVALPLLFLGALSCHGDLAAERPGVRHLTEFYLWVSLGGLLGGIANSIVAPVLFDSVAEFPITLALLLWLVQVRPESTKGHPVSVRVRLAALVGTLIAALVVGGATVDSRTIERGRSFFGVSRVMDSARMVRLVHGTTNHGAQMKEEALRHVPPSYYHPNGPMGSLVRDAPDKAHICLVGLGTGSLAILGRSGQQMTYYEIDPLVVRLAREHFSYLDESPANVAVRVGDGRWLLEREPDATCALLVIDAFTSDTIPTHLLTAEAIELLARKARPDGVTVFHVSNRHMDLLRVFRGLALETGARPLMQDYRPSDADRAQGAARALAVVLAPDDEVADALLESGNWRHLSLDGPSTYWTDDHSNLLSVLTDPLKWELDVAP